MDERREPPAEPGSGPSQAAAGTRLSPLQEAWGAYVEHATHCQICRSLDAGRCDTADKLWRAYQVQSEQAYRDVSGR